MPTASPLLAEQPESRQQGDILEDQEAEAGLEGGPGYNPQAPPLVTFAYQPDPLLVPHPNIAISWEPNSQNEPVGDISDSNRNTLYGRPKEGRQTRKKRDVLPSLQVYQG